MRSIHFFSLVLCLTAITLGATAQEMKQAVDLYNSAATTFKQNPQKASDDLKKSIEICQTLNTDESNKLMSNAKKVLPDVYFYLAQDLYKKKQTKESFEAMEASKTAADEINDAKRSSRATRTLSALYFQQGREQQIAGNYEEAIEMCKNSLKHNDRMLDIWIVLAQCQDSLKKYDDMLESLKQGMEAAQRAANLTRMKDMQILATNHLKAQAIQFQNENNSAAAIEALGKALEFDSRDATIYQPLAVAHGKLKNYDEVVKYADLALGCITPGMDKTGLYFIKAQALQAKGDNEGACESYKLAAEGEYKGKAEHEMKEVLKCK